MRFNPFAFVCQFAHQFLIAGLLGQLVGSLVGFREAMRGSFLCIALL